MIITVLQNLRPLQTTTELNAGAWIPMCVLNVDLYLLYLGFTRFLFHGSTVPVQESASSQYTVTVVK